MPTLVVNLVLSRIDYGNATLVGLPIYLQRRLESVLNLSARLIHNLPLSDNTTEALAGVQWLRVLDCITFKTEQLTFRALRGEAPHYLSEKPVCVADVSSRRRSVWLAQLVEPLAAPAHVHSCVQEVRVQSPEQTISTQDSSPPG